MPFSGELMLARPNKFLIVVQRSMMTLVLCISLAGCGSNSRLTPIRMAPDIPTGEAAYDALDRSTKLANSEAYKVGRSDTLAIDVFQEPEISVKELSVDPSGNVSLPLIGAVQAAGRTTSQIAQSIGQRLRDAYYKDPQVSVSVITSAAQKVAVQGEVTEPGVFDIKGGTTLLQAISLAKGETKESALNQVVVFREIEGQKMAAVFDVREIRSGRARDPQLMGNDLVVVGFSAAQRWWREIREASPLYWLFNVL